MSVGNGIKAYRLHRSLTQSQLAFRSGVSLDAITRIETGKRSPNVKTLEKLAKVLCVSPSSFFGDVALPILPDIDRIAWMLNCQPPHVVAAAVDCVEALVRAVTWEKQ